MLNTAAKQSPGKDANAFMLITRERGKDGVGKKNEPERERKGCV